MEHFLTESDTTEDSTVSMISNSLYMDDDRDEKLDKLRSFIQETGHVKDLRFLCASWHGVERCFMVDKQLASYLKKYSRAQSNVNFEVVDNF